MLTDHARASGAHSWSTFVLWVTCLVLAVPITVDLASSPKLRPFGYVAADVFYYLVVGRNIVDLGSFSSDGQNPTNGFHPLWQLCVAVTYGLCELFHATPYSVFAVILASLLCVIAALWILGRAMERGTGELSILYIGIPFGVYPLAVVYYWNAGWYGVTTGPGLEGPLPLFGTLYAFVNGMESGLTILAFAVVAWAFVRSAGTNSAHAGFACGGALAFLCLARLDHGAFALFPMSIWFSEYLRVPERRRFTASAFLAFAVPLLIYISINELYVGVALPVSGSLKTTFPFPSITTITAVIDFMKHPLTKQDLWLVIRIGPSVLSLLSVLLLFAALVHVRFGHKLRLFAIRKYATGFDIFLLQMAPGVLMLGAYNLAFVTLGHIGHWYSPVSTLYMSLVAISLCSIISKQFPRIPVSARVIGALCLSMAVIFGFLRYERQPEYMQSYARLYWDVAHRAKAALAGKIPKLLEVDDGIIGFSLGVPVMSGTHLNLDPEALRAAIAGHLANIAIGRGFSAVASFYYGDHHLRTNGDGTAARAWAQRLIGEDLSIYDASVLYGDGDLTIVGLQKRDR